MKKLLSLFAAAIILWPVVANSSECEVEEMVSRAGRIILGDFVEIEGVAACKNGTIVFRFYERKGGKFIGAKSTLIHNYTFKTIWQGEIPNLSNLFIKYTAREGY